MKKLFVGGLSWDTNDDQLKAAFEKFGEVKYARVITDKETGRSRGFGFVEFDNKEDARDACVSMNDSELDGRTIRVDFAKERDRGDKRGRTPSRHRDGNDKRQRRDRY